MSIIVALLFVFIYNHKIWSIYFTARDVNSLYAVFELMTFGLFVFFLLLALFSVFAFKRVQKVILIFVFMSGAIAMYFSNALNVYFDTDMIANIFETDYREATELIVRPLLLYIFILGILPSILILWVDIDYARFRPSSYIKASYSYAKKQWVLPASHQERISLDDSAVKNPRWNAYKKPLALVVIVGETARAESFSLQNGSTEGYLSQNNLVYFSNFNSCGTSTVISVPCMFMTEIKSEYKRNLQYQYENILDLALKSGFSTHWFDNLNGCKGLCQNVAEERPKPEDNPLFFHDEQFYDEVLVDKLDERIKSTQGDQLWVLHQMGSHGPAYYKRIPERFIQHQPACLTEDFSQCTQEAIRNTYTDTVLYSEYVISQAINKLESLKDTHDTALIYVSDHGESTGEMGLYLHGIPWMLAPDQQTHVPALLWFSDSYLKSRDLDLQCLASNSDNLYSHDNMSHTILSLLDIKTTAYQANLDLLSPCRAG